MSEPTVLERAVAEYRAAYPDDDDLPDEAVADLFVVRSRAFGIACQDFGSALAHAFGEQIRRSGFFRGSNP